MSTDHAKNLNEIADGLSDDGWPRNAEVRAAAERLAYCEAIIARLPKTADNVPVTPGDFIWYGDHYTLVPGCVGDGDGSAQFINGELRAIRTC